MTTDQNSTLKESMTSGMFVEFRDSDGHTIATEAFFDWNGSPVPAVGEVMCCVVFSRQTGGKEKLYGRVRQRQFDLQRDELGASCVWLYLVLEICDREDPRPVRGPVQFSNN